MKVNIKLLNGGKLPEYKRGKQLYGQEVAIQRTELILLSEQLIQIIVVN